MARKPNYDFERREREKAKTAKKEERAKAKADKKREAITDDAGAPGPEGANADQIAYWNGDAGERWAGLQGRIDGVFAPLTAAALAFAAPGRGSRVVDVGCGAGATVLELAKAVGPAGRVTGIDVSRPMLAVAERRVEAERLGNVELLLADASAHPFEPNGADLAFSRFGVMFFADPVGALANLRSGLAPGGRLAFACWQAMPASSWFEVPAAAVRALLPPAYSADPAAPGPFAFADPDRLRGLLDGAGFADVRIEPHRAAMTLGDLQAAVEFVTQVGPTSRALAQAEPLRRPALVEALRSALEPHGGPEGVVLEGAIWLVAARAP